MTTPSIAFNSGSYNSPGVYTQVVPGPLVGSTLPTPQAVGIFGSSVGYQSFIETDVIPPDTFTNQLTSPVLSSISTSFTGGTLTPGVYGYVVTAVGTTGETLASSEGVITAPTAILPPVLNAPTTASTGGTLSNNATYGYRVSAVNGSGETLASTEVTINLPAPLTTPAGLAVVVQGVAGSTTYGYRVSAVNAIGETLACSEVTVTTGNAALSNTNYNQLTWSAVAGATGYNVYGRTASGELKMTPTPVMTTGFNDTGAATPSGSLPGSNTSATSTNTVGLSWSTVAGATGYNVYGRTPSGELKMTGSPLSSSVLTFTDTGAATPSSALPSLNTTSTSTNSNTINWGSVASAVSYNVYGRVVGGELFIANVTGLSYTDTGVVNPTTLPPTLNTTGTPSANFTPNLVQLGIIPSTIVVRDTATNTTYTVGVDYTVTLSSGNSLQTDSYRLKRIVGGGLPAQTSIQVSYQYTNASYFKANTFYSYNDVASIYGTPFDADGNIQSELTLAAMFAFANGAQQVVAAAVQASNGISPSISDYVNALNTFDTISNIQVVVPANGQQALFSYVQQHVDLMSSNQMERRAILGRDGSITAVSSPVRMSNAQGINDQRIAVVSPATFLYANSITNTMQTLGGQFAAAAVAGRAVSQNPALPLTRDVIQGFVGVAEVDSAQQKNLEAQAGLMVIETTLQGITRVRHGLTTSPGSIYTAEWSIIAQQDFMAYSLRNGLDNDGLIGNVITDTTLASVLASVESTLTSLQSSGTIYGYQNLTISQRPQALTVIQISFDWQASAPLNYIVASFTVNIATGAAVTDSTTSSATSATSSTSP